MSRWVEIVFDCMPLRSIGRMDVPIDASPTYQAFCERVKSAIDTHGSFNTYYLYNAKCTFHLTNDEAVGMVQFRFEGTIMTDQADERTVRSALDATLLRETCGWLNEPVVEWLGESVKHAVQVEFDRFIAAGDLEQTRQRIEQLQAASDDADGFLGMYL